jgi:hypothetical protein
MRNVFNFRANISLTGLALAADGMPRHRKFTAYFGRFDIAVASVRSSVHAARKPCKSNARL